MAFNLRHKTRSLLEYILFLITNTFTETLCLVQLRDGMLSVYKFQTQLLTQVSSICDLSLKFIIYFRGASVTVQNTCDILCHVIVVVLDVYDIKVTDEPMEQLKDENFN